MSRINIFVRTKHQEIFNRFLETFIPTVEGYDTTLYVFHPEGIVVPEVPAIVSVTSEYLGNTAYIPYLRTILTSAGKEIWKDPGIYFGIFNDDLVFGEGWLEDVISRLEKYGCVTPGFVNTTDMDVFKKAVEKTKNEEGVIDYFMGACQLMKIGVFLKIGMLDPQFDWSMDDFDMLWRMELNGVKTVTLKKVSIAHAHGSSRMTELKRWYAAAEDGKQKFVDKHGAIALKTIRETYKAHKYFTEIRRSIEDEKKWWI